MNKTLDENRTVSPLQEMTKATQTCLWNDSIALEELKYSIKHGAVGATCNPVIVLDALKQEMGLWQGRIKDLINEMPTATEDQIGWALVEEMSASRAKLLMPAFEKHEGRNGRLSIQTDPRLFRDKDAMVAQALRFNRLAPNMIVKIPATSIGIQAMEEVSAQGVNINATVSFSVSQAIAVAEAIERGLRRREERGEDISGAGSVCTIMVGRVDDWLKAYANKHDIVINPGYLEWAGVAVFKKAYEIFQQRGYRVRLLAAAYRNHLQWSELIGGDIVLSPPTKWQMRFNKSDVTVENRIDNPVDPVIVKELLQKFPDFVKAYLPDGMTASEFDTFPPTQRTLLQFFASCNELSSLIRSHIVENPDK